MSKAIGIDLGSTVYKILRKIMILLSFYFLFHPITTF